MRPTAPFLATFTLLGVLSLATASAPAKNSSSGAFLPQDASIAFKWKATLDWETTLSFDTQTEAPDGTVGFKWDSNMKVTKVEEDGAYEVTIRTTNARLAIDGEEEALPDDDEPEIVKYDAKGNEIVDENSEEEEESTPLEMIEYVLDFEPEHSVKIGDRWKKVTELVEQEVSFAKSEVVDGVPCHRLDLQVKITGPERSGEGSGTVWIKASNFELVKAEGSFADAKLGEEWDPMKFKFSVNAKKD